MSDDETDREFALQDLKELDLGHPLDNPWESQFEAIRNV